MHNAHTSLSLDAISEEFEDWFDRLKDLGRQHGERILDIDAWMPEFEAGKCAEEAFFSEFPEHANQGCSSKKQHSVACRECPFKRTSAPGWLGATQPGEFLALADSDHRTPCHMHVDYDKADWETAAKTAPQCVGRATFLANRCKLPAPGLLKASANRDDFFSRPHEFVAHHARLDPSSLETTMVWDLYKITR